MKEANRTRVRAIPDLKIETWGTQDWRGKDRRMDYLTARRELPGHAKKKCTPKDSSQFGVRSRQHPYRREISAQ
jgi:hypothetical protein